MTTRRATQPEQEDFAENFRKQANVAALVAGTFAAFAEILFFRRDFGARYFAGLRIPACLALIPLFSVFWRYHDLTALYVVWLAFVVRCVFHRVALLRSQWRIANVIGVRPQHSHYNGVAVLTFAKKHTELRDRLASIKLQLDVLDRSHDENAELAVKVFELSQTLRQQWITADYAAKRRILEIVCLNCTLDGATLYPQTRKPFDVLIEGLPVLQSRGDRI